MQNLHPAFFRAPLFSGMTQEDITALLPCLHSREKAYPKDSCLLRMDEPVNELGLLLEGAALIEQEDFWGNRNIVARITTGQLFAEAAACSRHSNGDMAVYATQPSRVLWINTGCIMTPCQKGCDRHMQLIRNLLSSMAQKNFFLNEKLSHVTQRTIRQKLLAYLSSEAARLGSRSFSIPYDRQQLADYLAVDRSALSAELSRLRRDGLLRCHKNNFTLLAE